MIESYKKLIRTKVVAVDFFFQKRSPDHFSALYSLSAQICEYLRYLITNFIEVCESYQYVYIISIANVNVFTYCSIKPHSQSWDEYHITQYQYGTIHVSTFSSEK